MVYIKGFTAAILALLNVVIMAIPFFTVVLLKVLIRFAACQKILARVVTALARRYNQNNALIFRCMSHIDWQVTGVENLRRDGNYLVIANHQSWADIPVLQHVIEQHIPLLKFFLKKELIWVPVLGAAWWALDFPFMKRHSREYLEKHPEKRGEDLAETRRLCERFKDAPVSVMSFLEGTRFTPEKHQAQDSPYAHLLRPKVGGAALVINTMGEAIDTVVDVTIDYDVAGGISIWKLFSGQVRSVSVNARLIAIPSHFAAADYEAQPQFRSEIQNWFHQIWLEKDRLLSQRRIGRNKLETYYS